MKKNITKAQLEEIPQEQQDYIQDIILGIDIRMGMYFGMDIGQMIEFLGEDLDKIMKTKRGFTVITNFKKGNYTGALELVDALWEAVKFKLNNNEPTKTSK